MNERDMLADLIRILGSVNSRVCTTENDLKRVENILQMLINEIADLKERNYQYHE